MCHPWADLYSPQKPTFAGPSPSNLLNNRGTEPCTSRLQRDWNTRLGLVSARGVCVLGALLARAIPIGMSKMEIN